MSVMISKSDTQIAFSAIAFLHIPFSILLVTAMRSAKHIPFASKYLAIGLILFDASYIAGSTLRKFIDNPWLNIQINVLVFIFLQLSYSTMALMSLDRMYVLAWPMAYLRIASETRIRIVAFTVWASVVLLFGVVRYPGCWMAIRTEAVFSIAGTCNKVVTFYYIGLVAVVETISIVCYFIVFKIVRKHTLQDGMKVSFKNFKTILRTYKSTSMVLIYIVVMTITSLVYAILIVLIRKSDIDPDSIRFFIDMVSVFNCFLDPFLYVLWYEECRIKCKSLVSAFLCCGENLQEKKRFRSYDDIYAISI